MDFTLDGIREVLWGLAPYACVATVIAGTLGIAYVQLQSHRNAWAELASHLGMHFEPGTWFVRPRVNGTYRRHQVTLDTFTRGSGKNKTTYTRVVMTVENPTGVSLTLYEEGFFSKIGKMLGGKDIQIGDEEIDRRFIIRCEPETFAVRLFTSINLRAKLLEAKPVNIKVEGNQLYHERRGVEKNAEALTYLFDLLTDVADFVERA